MSYYEVVDAYNFAKGRSNIHHVGEVLYYSFSSLCGKGGDNLTKSEHTICLESCVCPKCFEIAITHMLLIEVDQKDDSRKRKRVLELEKDLDTLEEKLKKRRLQYDTKIQRIKELKDELQQKDDKLNESKMMIANLQGQITSLKSQTS